VSLESETRRAVESNDPDLLRRRIAELESLKWQVLLRRPEWWVGYFDYLEKQKPQMRDPIQADWLLAQGRRAINGEDMEALKASVRQLVDLLPPAEREIARGYGGTTIRWLR